MTIEQLGAIGEFVGSLLTLVTLAYLAVQVRQNTAQQRREEIVAIHHGQNDVVRQLQDPAVIGGYVRTATEMSPSIEDRGASFSWVVQYLNHFQIVHEIHKAGGISDEHYELWKGFAVAIVAPSGIQLWWDGENGRMGFHSDVREAIDAALRDEANPPVPLTEMWTQFMGPAWAEAASRGGGAVR